MKKIIGASALIIGLALASCGGGSQTKVVGGLDSLFTSAQADTLVMTTAQVGGWQIGNLISQAMVADSTFSKQQFLKGVKYALDADTATSFAYGMQIGTNINNTIKYWSQAGIQIDRDAFFRQFEHAVLQDSVSIEERQSINALNSAINTQFSQALSAYEDYKIEASEISQANIKRGQQYVDSIAGANPDVKITASGLAYQIINSGSDKKAADDDLVEIWYTAKTIDGETFDKSDSISARPLPLRMRNEGLKQGVALLGEGGEAVVYVPGKLAYGANKSQRFGLTPNQMVIYTLKVNKIQTQAEAAAAKKDKKDKKK